MPKGIRRGLAVVWGFILLIWVNGNARLPAMQEIRSEVLHGIILTTTNRFAEADSLFREMTRKYPEHPVGWFYLCANLQAKMLDAEDFSEKEEFYRLSRLTVEKARAAQEKYPENAWLWFYEGNAYLYESYQKSRDNSWFAALKLARKGAGRLEEAFEKDSTLYDALLGIGTFKYWKSAKTQFINWLPIISDERDKGIQMVRKAIEKGFFSRWVARDQLSWILMDKGDLEEAYRLARANIEEFPQSRFFKWTYLETTFRKGNLEEAFQIYKELLNEIRRLPNNNHYNEIGCLVNMAEIAEKLGQPRQAVQLARQALQIRVSKKVGERSRKRLERARKLVERLEKS